MHLKVDPCAFATNTELFQALEKINNWILWLSEAASDEEKDMNKSVIPQKLHRSSSREALRIPDVSWVMLEQSIRHDDVDETTRILVQTREHTPNISERQFQQFLKGLLQRAITSRSQGCVVYLLGQIVFLDDAEDLNRRNCIHRLVISIGRAHANTDASAEASVPDPEKELYSFITFSRETVRMYEVVTKPPQSTTSGSFSSE